MVIRQCPQSDAIIQEFQKHTETCWIWLLIKFTASLAHISSSECRRRNSTAPKMGFWKKSDTTVLFSFGRIFKQDTPETDNLWFSELVLMHVNFHVTSRRWDQYGLWGYTVAPLITRQSRYSISTVAPHWSFGPTNRIEWRNAVSIQSRDCQDTRDSTVTSRWVSWQWCPFSGKIGCIGRLCFSAECGHTHRRKVTHFRFRFNTETFWMLRLYGAFPIFHWVFRLVPAKDA